MVVELSEALRWVEGTPKTFELEVQLRALRISGIMSAYGITTTFKLRYVNVEFAIN